MTRARLATALLAAAMLAGCATNLPQPDAAHAVAAQLADYRRAAAAPAAEQRRAFDAAQAAFAAQPNDTTRLALILALLLPDAAWRDDERAAVLLEDMRAVPGAPPSARQDLAELLRGLIAERRRAERDAARALRKQEHLVHQANEERHRAEDMRQKIDALLAIDRDQRARRKPP